MKKRIFYIAMALVSVVALVIYSCSKSSGGYGSNSSGGGGYGGGGGGNPGANAVYIQNMAFSPDTLRVTVGSTVTWTNMDGVTHTATQTGGLFNSGNIAAGSSYSYTFATAGSYTYHCLIHSMMKSAVIIAY